MEDLLRYPHFLYKRDNDLIKDLLITDLTVMVFLVLLTILQYDQTTSSAFRFTLGCTVILVFYSVTTILRMGEEKKQKIAALGSVIGSAIFFIPFLL